LEDGAEIYSYKIENSRYSDFYVSEAKQDFYFILISKNGEKHKLVVLEKPDDYAHSPYVQNISPLELKTQEFYCQEFPKNSYFEDSKTFSMSNSEIEFSTENKSILRILCDQVYSHLIYIYYSDNTIECFSLITDYMNQISISKIHEISFDDSTFEQTSVKIDSNLHILGITQGKIYIFDKSNSSEMNFDDQLPDGSLSLIDNFENVFDVSAPAFENLHNHETNSNLGELKEESASRIFKNYIKQLVQLNLLEKAFSCCSKDSLHKDLVEMIGSLSLKQNLIDLSIKCFSSLKNLSMVLSLKRLLLQSNNQSQQLMGETAIILCDYQFALKFFFEAGNLNKVLFLCGELHLNNLVIDLISYLTKSLSSCNQ
jgi:hypothetical protein